MQNAKLAIVLAAFSTACASLRTAGDGVSRPPGPRRDYAGAVSAADARLDSIGAKGTAADIGPLLSDDVVMVYGTRDTVRSRDRAVAKLRELQGGTAPLRLAFSRASTESCLNGGYESGQVALRIETEKQFKPVFEGGYVAHWAPSGSDGVVMDRLIFVPKGAQSPGPAELSCDLLWRTLYAERTVEVVLSSASLRNTRSWDQQAPSRLVHQVRSWSWRCDSVVERCSPILGRISGA